jgi:hypothetical protein
MADEISIDPICPSFEFYNRKVNEHGGEKRRTLVHMGQEDDITSEDNLVAIVVEAEDGEVFILTATPEEGDTQTNHRFVFSEPYEEICKDPLHFIDIGIEMFLEAAKAACQGTA